MAKKVTYTLSEPIPNKEGSGCYISATPNAYAAPLNVRFDSEAEARGWLIKDSKGWLDRLHAGRNAKRPTDPNAIAKMMVDIASGETETSTYESDGRSKAAGGFARAAALPRARRSEIASKAAKTRWNKGV